MKRVGIALDTWKMPIFIRLLSDAEFDFEIIDKYNNPETSWIYVTTNDVGKLSTLIYKANIEAETAKGGKGATKH